MAVVISHLLPLPFSLSLDMKTAWTLYLRHCTAHTVQMMFDWAAHLKPVPPSAHLKKRWTWRLGLPSSQFGTFLTKNFFLALNSVYSSLIITFLLTKQKYKYYSKFCIYHSHACTCVNLVHFVICHIFICFQHLINNIIVCSLASGFVFFFFFTSHCFMRFVLLFCFFLSSVTFCSVFFHYYFCYWLPYTFPTPCSF